MAGSFWTNRGLYLMARAYLANQAVPTNFYVALVTDDTPPTPATNTLSDLAEVAAGHGYTAGGVSLGRNTTDFPSFSEDDSVGFAAAAFKSVSWTASGGAIPASGSNARWAVLTTDEATVANRQVVAVMDLGGDTGAASGQTITLPAGVLYLAQP